MLTYSELIQIPTFIDRFRYLKLSASVGEETYGWDRYLNQTLYKSREWRETRERIIIRDDGCDLAHPDYPIGGRILIHHLNPITKRDILDRNPLIFDPENLVCISHITHEAVHYGSEDLLMKDPVERTPGDTKLW
jgi:hypothetical protein